MCVESKRYAVISSEEVPMSPPDPRGASVLVVEDNPVNQLLVRQQLEHLGHRPTICATAGEGLRHLEDGHAFELVLMDWQLPDIDGLEATRLLRERERKSGRHVPVVAMTASAMPEDRAACRDAGMDDFMAKPVGLEELAAMVTKWTDGRPDAGFDDPRQPTAGFADALDALHRDLDDVELVRSLVERFLQELDGRRDGFREAVARGDLATLHRIAHTLKSTSELMGAGELAEVCREAERVEDPAELAAVEDRFVRSADATEAGLRAWLDNQASRA